MQDQTLNIAREKDPDRYLLSLLCPAKHRAALWALIAYNYEVAKTADVVSEPMTGKIRLQWWRDTVEEIYNDENPRQHEVVLPLANIIKQYDLEKDHLLAMINVREFDLEYKSPADWESFEIYARKCNEPLNKLILKILDESDSEENIKSISFFYGAVGLLRTIPHQLSRRHLIFPADGLEAEGLSMQKILDFKKEDALQPFVNKALQDLGVIEETQPQSKFLRTQKQLARLYYHQLKKFEGDLFNPKTHYPIPFLALRLFFTK